MSSGKYRHSCGGAYVRRKLHRVLCVFLFFFFFGRVSAARERKSQVRDRERELGQGVDTNMDVIIFSAVLAR